MVRAVGDTQHTTNMKKIALTLICAAAAIGAHAQFKFKSLDNHNGKTTIVIVDDNFQSDSQISSAKFNNDGKTFEAKSLEGTCEDNQMTVSMTFRKMTVFNNTSVTVTLNGQEINIPINL